ncbi:MAG: hypothetical protein PF444_07380 [Bacteroidales bacterium]|jgi:hypothetical protein|nr:hypothetical protein [Bacteroidales bacterium]
MINTLENRYKTYTMNLQRLILSTIIIGLTLCSCNTILDEALLSQEENTVLDEEILSQEAVVTFAGEAAFDGCGWIIETKDNIYYPTNLDDVFQIDSLSINLEFTPLESRHCNQWGTPGIQEIEILNIEQKVN